MTHGVQKRISPFIPATNDIYTRRVSHTDSKEVTHARWDTKKRRHIHEGESRITTVTITKDTDRKTTDFKKAQL